MPAPTDSAPEITPHRNPIIALGWCVLGWLALILAALGALLPLLPTTPFVILAAFAFARGSRRMHDRLLRNRLFGPAIRDWRANGAIAVRYKLAAIVMMAAAFIGAILAGVPPYALILQALCMSLAAAYVLSRPGTGKTGDTCCAELRPASLHAPFPPSPEQTR